MLSNVQTSVLPKTPTLSELPNVGKMGDKEVKVEKKDTKSTNIFKRVICGISSFIFFSIKFSLKTILFITGVSPALAITRCFWSLIRPKNKGIEAKKPYESNQEPQHVAPVAHIKVNTEPSTSAAELHQEIQEIISRIEQENSSLPSRMLSEDQNEK